MRIGEDRAPRWARFIHSGCCGGNGALLPRGLRVASSGCGGVLTWFDDDGHVLFQSEPHEGIGLATALSSEVTALSTGAALVAGGPGLLAYDRGELLWSIDASPSAFAVRERDRLLVTCDQAVSVERQLTVSAHRL